MSEHYVKVYYSIRTDPRFETIYGDDAALAAWLRLLMAADAIWPAPADIPKWVRQGPFRKLVEAGVVEVSGQHYRIHGMDNERGRRSDRASNAAAARWAAAGSSATGNAGSNAMSNAETMPLRAEQSRAAQSRAEQSNDDPVETYYLLTTRAPRGRALDWCKRLGDQYGFRATSDAMADAWGDSDEVGTLLSRTENLLVLAARNAERREQAAELARIRAKRERRAIEAQVPPSEMTEEEIAAEVERYRSSGVNDDA
jgi:hypothetical protein